MFQAAMSAACAVVAAAIAGRLVDRTSVELGWDGAEWRVAGQPARVSLMCDLDRSMLVRTRARHAGVATRAWPWHVQWFFVSAKDAGPGFHAWRAALLHETEGR